MQLSGYNHRRLAERPDALPNVLTFPKSIELEQRISQAEGTIIELREAVATSEATAQSLRETVDVLHKRIVSLQAQLDHLFGKIVRY